MVMHGQIRQVSWVGNCLVKGLLRGTEQKQVTFALVLNSTPPPNTLAAIQGSNRKSLSVFSPLQAGHGLSSLTWSVEDSLKVMPSQSRRRASSRAAEEVACCIRRGPCQARLEVASGGMSSHGRIMFDG